MNEKNVAYGSLKDEVLSKFTTYSGTSPSEMEIDNHSQRIAALYCRTSSPNQRNNYSVDQQIEENWKYAKSRNWQVGFIYVDECKSGKTIDRPKFKLMIERARTKTFNVIIVWKLDRFCRSLVDLVNVEKELRSHNVELCSVTEFVDTTSSVGRFNYRNLASVAELERELIGERSRLGLYGLAREGRWPNSRPPLGYDIGTSGRLALNSSEILVVRRIFTDYIKLNSMAQIAFNLNKEKISTKAESVPNWNARAVRNILTNRIYIGRYCVAGCQAKIEEYRIISDELFQESQKIRKRYENPGECRPPMPIARRHSELHYIHEQYSTFMKNLN